MLQKNSLKIYLYFLDDLCAIRKNGPSVLKHFNGSKGSSALHGIQSYKEATGGHQV